MGSFLCTCCDEDDTFVNPVKRKEKKNEKPRPVPSAMSEFFARYVRRGEDTSADMLKDLLLMNPVADRPRIAQDTLVLLRDSQWVAMSPGQREGVKHLVMTALGGEGGEYSMAPMTQQSSSAASSAVSSPVSMKGKLRVHLFE